MADAANVRPQEMLRALQEARQQLLKFEASASEPIAIVGMGCRLPGGAHGPGEFARLLFDGGDTRERIPATRWDADAFHHPDPEHPGTSVARHGCFVRDLDRFDADFFGISAREARFMDPQQRLLLEVAWETLEHGAIPALTLAGRPVGVFMGMSTNEYAALNGAHGSPQEIERYSGTGSAFCVSSGRISHLLGLEGPCLTVDTACSSSLVAVHLACRSLRARECELALAGGVNALIHPSGYVYFSRMRALSPRGVCNTFDARADGYVRGEGCGMVALARLSDAVAAGYRVLAVIRGSAVNHDGRSSGLTIPNGPAQVKVIEAALAAARVRPRDVGYVEAHGTGTALGDPIEMGALAQALGAERAAGQELWVGSVKTNIGHLEAAAGIAGLIKVVLTLQHRRIPAHLHLEQPSPHIAWDELPLRVPRESRTWESDTRVAGISAFGFSGTNAHVVVGEAPDSARPREADRRDPGPGLLCLSARSQSALRALVRAYREHLEAHPELDWRDVCFTAAVGRSHLPKRITLIADDLPSGLAGLKGIEAEANAEAGARPSPAAHPEGIALFLGDAGAPPEQASVLYATSRVFRAAFDACGAIAQKLGLALPRPDSTDRGSSFAATYALVQLLRSWALEPTVLTGEGSGFFLACAIAEALSLEDAFAAAHEPNRTLSLVRPQKGLLFATTGAAVPAGTWRPPALSTPDPSRPRDLFDALRSHSVGAVLELGARANSPHDAAALWRSDHRLWWRATELPANGLSAPWPLLAAFYERGFTPNFSAVFADLGGGHRRIDLPTYRFDRSRHWMDASRGLATRAPDADVSVEARVPRPDTLALRWVESESPPATGGPPNGDWLICGSDATCFALAETLRARAAGTVTHDHVGPLDGLSSRYTDWVLGPMPVEELLRRVVAWSRAEPEAGPPSRLWIVTRGGQFVAHDRAPEATEQSLQALLWGLGRGIALERPERWGGCIDLDPAGSDPGAEAAAILTELGRTGPEDQLAWRRGRRHVLRLEPRALEATGPLRLSEDASYVIVGGLGSIGGHLAHWLAERGARHLVLTGLRPPRAYASLEAMFGDPELQTRLDFVARLRAKGVRVRALELDVRSAEAVDAALASVERDGPPIRGIFHLAGVRESAALADMDEPQFARVCAPKVDGAIHLDRWSRARKLDFFVLFSSVAGVWGSAGLGAYGAANRFLDQLANARHAAGLPALSVAWGPWSGGGMVSESEASQLEELGLQPLKAPAAFEPLERAMTSGVATVVVVAANWARFRAVYEARPRRALLHEIPADGGGASEVLPWQSSTPGARPRRFGEPLDEGRVRDVLAGRLERILESSSAPVAFDRPLVALGLDSLMALDLVRAVEQEFGVKLPVEELMAGADLGRVVQLIVALAAAERPEVPSDAAHAPQPETAPTRRADDARSEALLPVNDESTSTGQYALWHLHQMTPESVAYNMVFALWLQPDAELGPLARAARRLADRHPSLRSTYRLQGQRLVAQVRPSAPVEIHDQEGSGTGADTLAACLRDADEPFDLERGPLLRLRHVRFSDGRRLLIASTHHIGVDFRSAGILRADLEVLYAAELRGQPAELPPLTSSPGAFAAHEARRLDAKRLQELGDYWSAHLAGAPPTSTLRTDRPRPAHTTWEGRTYDEPTSVELGRRVLAHARAAAVTPFTLLVSVFHVLLHRYTGEDDVLIGTPVTVADDADAISVVGTFVNPVVLRSDVSRDPTFAEYLRGQAQVVSKAVEHRHFPFSKLVERLSPERHANCSPLFQVAFVYLQATAREVPSLLSTGTAFQGQRGAAQDFTLTVVQTGEGLGVRATYNSALFEEASVRRILRHYLDLLDAAITHPDTPVSQLEFSRAEEQHDLRVTWNDTDCDYSRALLEDGFALHMPFLRRATETPDAVALGFGEQTLTYGELSARARRLSRQLAAQGVGPGDVVGICMDRSIELMVAIYGVVCAGAAYLPLDPSDPSERYEYMLDNAGARLVLAARPVPGSKSVLVLSPGGALAPALASDGPSEAEPRVPSPEDIAYVIYTSGSTGRPKGVMVSHRAVRNRLLWMQETYGLTRDDRVLQKTPITFDVSVWELFWPLAVGARLVLAAPGEHRIPSELGARIERDRITVAHFVPSVLQGFLNANARESYPSLRLVFCSGEELPSSLCGQFLGQLRAELHNLYGPTEAAIDVTAWHCTSESLRSGVPIGRPVANTRIYLLDVPRARGAIVAPGRPRRLAPAGVPGELAIAGIQVASGYVGQPELTAQRFVEDPFSTAPGARMYLTGDLARYRSDGAIEFLGRIDQQVKVRGVRIEPGEIEAVLQEHPSVRESAVVVDKTTSGDCQLVGYVALRNPGTQTAELRAFLGERLPAAMVPARLAIIDAMPLTASGKLDRKKLGSLAVPSASEPAEEAPRNPTLSVLLEIVRQLLANEAIGPFDDFFAVGGHSLLVTELVARIEARFQIRLTPRTVFETPGLASLAARIERNEPRHEDGVVRVARRGDAHLSLAQQRIWMLHQLDSTGAAYNSPAVLRLRGSVDRAAIEQALSDMIERHEPLRTVFPATDGRPVQRVTSATPFRLLTVDLSEHPPEVREAECGAALERNARRSFDLARGPLLRASLIRLAAKEHLLAITLHHIVLDGWSVGLLLNEWSERYASHAAGRARVWPELRVQYLDYVDWERRHFTEERLATELAFWQRHLVGAAPAIAWPESARPVRPLGAGAGGAAAFVSLPPELCDAVRARAKQIESTVFTLLLAGFALTLRRVTGQEDLVVGTVTASRELPELTEMIGCFINFLPLRLRPSELYTELLADTKRVLRDALAHQSCPFDRIVASAQRRSRDPGSPLYNVALLWQGFEGWSARRELVLGPELVARVEPVSTDAPLLDLRLVAEPEGDGIRVGAEYRADRLNGAFVTQLLAELGDTLRALALGDARTSSLEMQPVTGEDETFLTVLSEMSDEQASLLLSEQPDHRVDGTHD